MFSRCLRLCAYILAFCLFAAALFVLVPLYRSMPDRGTSITLPTLADISAVQRDRHGLVRINAVNRRDAAKLLGFAHAQDRFFQMDLLRRTAAGELAELLGPSALPSDRANRRLRLREVARTALDKLPEPQRDLVEDYTFGVAMGLVELEQVPFEYLLLRTQPTPWKSEDSLLVIAALSLSLQRTDGRPELTRAVVRDNFVPAAADFLLSSADDFAAALDNSRIEPPALPERLEFTASAAATPPTANQPTAAPPAAIPAAGGTAFAVRGLRGSNPVALLAGDLQLPLAVPNLWYRAEIVWRIDDRHNRTVDGLTLPGLPMLFAGSNGYIAWTFTPAAADTADLIPLETDPAQPDRYRTPEGWLTLERRTETIAVRGTAPETITYDTTIWGPVIGTDPQDRPLALRWAMADPSAYDLQIANLETVNTARTALAFAKSLGLPALNFIVADRDGGIGWTVAGRLPLRAGFDGATPSNWADGSARWDGWLPRERYPQIYNPASGRLCSAGNRLVGGDAFTLLGDGGLQPGARAQQIQERLASLKELSPESLLDIELDTRGLYLERWHDLLLAALAPAAASDPGRAELLRLASAWGGRAEPGSAGYRLVHDFRATVIARVDHLLFARCRAALPAFDASTLPLDRIAFTLVRHQPAGWHPDGAPGWAKLLLDSADTVIAEAGGANRLAQHTWGDANRVAMQHPLSAEFPRLARFLDAAAEPLPGDPETVRAQAPGLGTTFRLAIRPGWEAGSLLHMPGGQSAHPLSPYFFDGHQSWLKGEPTPLQPGRTEDSLVFRPPSAE